MISTLKKLWPTIFGDQLAKSRAARPMLKELEVELTRIRQCLTLKERDGIELIVPFFGAIATVQDADITCPVIAELSQFSRYDRLVEKMDTFNEHLRNTGRDMYGMNRTVPGQVVTEEDVFLGNVDGYWTKSVAYISAPRLVTDYYSAMERQARRFMSSHMTEMINILREFDQALTPEL